MAIEFNAEERIITPSYSAEDREAENTLRPRTLEEFLGQEKVKENLGVYIDAAKLREEPLDHVLLHGPPGLGKTSLAGVIANVMGVNIRITSGPAIERPSDLTSLLSNLAEHDILFIDEIHRISASTAEVLYPAMEDYAFDIITGKGMTARSYHIQLPRFTLIGATTRAGQLTPPLRDRFGVQLRLEMYTPAEIGDIIDRSAGILGIPIQPDGRDEIARRSRFTPRVANRLLRRVRDYAQVRGSGVVDKSIADVALSAMEIDEIGLDNIDRMMLRSIIGYYGGGPVGLETIAATIGEETVTLEDMVEPYLLQLGFIKRTPRGRCATPAAYKHLGLPFEGQTELP